MHTRTPKLLTRYFALALGLIGTFANAALVSNGDFETGDFSGWTQFGDPSNTAVDTVAAQFGAYGAYFGSVGDTGGIKQTLTTSANQFYTVKFWLMSEADVNNTSIPNSFDISWGGNSVTSLVDASAFGYSQYTFTLQATSVSTDLSFTFQNDPAFWDLDSVSVTESANPDGGTVPEPGSLALVGLAGALAGLLQRRRAAGIDV